jgi:ABC-type multidrug transport system fused ATPase/permease subunit
LSYWKSIAWLWQEAFLASKRRVLWSIASQFLAALAELGIAGVLFLAFRDFQKASSDVLNGPVITLPQLMTLLAVVGTLLAVNGLLRFNVERQISAIFLKFEASLIQRVMTKIGGMKLHDMLKNEFVPTQQTTTRAVQMDTRFCGMALRSLIRSVVPLVFFVAASAFLFWYNAAIAIVLFACLLMFFPVIYFLNKRAVKVSKEFELATRSVSGLKSRMVADVFEQSDGSQASSVAAGHLRNSIYSNYGDLLGERLMIMSRSNVLNATFAAFSLVAVLATFGWQALNDLRDWQDIIFCFLAVRFILGSVQQLSGLFAALNRFFTQVERQHKLLKLDLSPLPNFSKEKFSTTKTQIADAKYEELEIGPGSKHILLSAKPATRRLIEEELAILGLLEAGPRDQVLNYLVALYSEGIIATNPTVHKDPAASDTILKHIEGDLEVKPKPESEEEKHAIRMFRNRARNGGWDENGAWDDDFRSWMSELVSLALSPQINFIIVDLDMTDRLRNDQAQRFLESFPKKAIIVRAQRFVRKISQLPIENSVFFVNGELAVVRRTEEIKDDRAYYASLVDRSDDSTGVDLQTL